MKNRRSVAAVFLSPRRANCLFISECMSDSAFNYFNRLDSLDLSDLEILSDKITTLIFKKKKTDSLQIKEGLSFFNNIKGSVDRKIDEKQELKEALDEKYSYST